jgi:uncharacterized protein (TIGR00255 family)
MTGYGRGQSVHKGAKVTVELSAVNRKQSDISVALPRELAELEPRVRDTINNAVTRGRLNVVVAYHSTSNVPASWALDEDLAKTYLKAMRDLSRELRLPGEITIETILRAPGVIKAPGDRLDPEEMWPLIEAALGAALGDLVRMRDKEGRNLGRDLTRRIKLVKDYVKRIRKLQPGVVKRYREQLHDRINKAGLELPIDDDRLVKEVVVFADRSDITEELTRLESHFDQFAQHIEKDEPVGRTMEFLCQEISRELNTMGSKANDVEISQVVVMCKAEMEKIREQVQNIE